jgi:hypothetical protein
VGQTRFIDVEYPAWVIVAYPAYVPQILDIVTMDDVLQDLAIRQFAARTDLYGTAGTFAHPQHIAPTDQAALSHWRAGRLRWNPDYKPWFYRDVWTILYRPDEYSYLCDVLGQSNYPHNQSTRGTFDPDKLGLPPVTDWQAVAACETQYMQDYHTGRLFVDTLAPALLTLETPSMHRRDGAAAAVQRLLAEQPAGDLQEALAGFARTVHGDDPGTDFARYRTQWRATQQESTYAPAQETLERAVDQIVASASVTLPAHSRAGCAC